MQNIENDDHLPNDPVNNIEVPASTDPVKVPGVDTPAPQPAKQLRNQHLKKPDPKNWQLGGRCTEAEFALINKALKDNNCADIVRLTLYAINLFKKDILTPFKT